MKLSDVISPALIKDDAAVNLDVEVTGLKIDSRDVSAGDLFIALPSYSGHDISSYINQARNSGGVVMTENDVHDIHQALGAALAAFFPTVPNHRFAVTGTNGKSSIVDFIRQLLDLSHIPVASIGTVGVFNGAGQEIFKTEHTSPDALKLWEYLSALKSQDIDHIALEASSHGLHQNRLGGLMFEAVAFTNLTHEHLDYHGSMAEYFDAKSRLMFNHLIEDGTAVINIDDPYGIKLNQACLDKGIETITIGSADAADIQIVHRDLLPDGQKCQLKVFGKEVDLHFPLIGHFQLFNALCAFALVKDHVADVYLIEDLKGVNGRLEKVASHNDAQIYIDYAHTPDALETVLKSIRKHCQNRLHVVFGCGGDRDAEKRPLMGEIAYRLADQVIVTDDNPRTEDANQIRTEILKSCPEAIEIGDRFKAIEWATSKLEPGDILLVAGKGHENGQIIGLETLPFSDKDVITRVVNQLKDETTK